MWIFLPILFSLLAIGLMFGMSCVMALAGTTHASDCMIMLVVTIPAAFILAFAIRRSGVLRATCGGALFAAPVVLLVHGWIAELKRDNMVEAAQSCYLVSYATLITAVSAAAFFAALARASEETKDERHVKS